MQKLNNKKLEPVLTYPDDYFTNYEKYDNILNFNKKIHTNSKKIEKMFDIYKNNINIFSVNIQRYPEKYIEFLNYDIEYQKKMIEEMMINIHQTNEYILNLKK